MARAKYHRLSISGALPKFASPFTGRWRAVYRLAEPIRME